MDVVSATDRRGHCIETGGESSRKTSASLCNKFVAVSTRGIIMERSLQGRDTGEMDALMWREQTVASQKKWDY